MGGLAFFPDVARLHKFGDDSMHTHCRYDRCSRPGAWDNIDTSDAVANQHAHIANKYPNAFRIEKYWANTGAVYRIFDSEQDYMWHILKS